MYRPHAIRPVWEMRRGALAVSRCYGGGTSSTPEVPPEFRPLIEGSVNRMLGQQNNNPIGGYNAPNPMATEGFSPGESLGMGYATGNMMASPYSYLAAQAAQRAAGMAGAGPTTGYYDPSGEMGLQDWAKLSNRYLGQGGEMGPQTMPQDGLNDAIGGNATPQGGSGTDYTGGPPIVGGPTAPSGSGSSHSMMDANMPLQQAMAAMGPNHSWADVLGMSGADIMAKEKAMHPNAAPTLVQGTYQGPGGGIGGSHTFMTYDSNHNLVPIAEQNGLNGEAGKMWDRPTDPTAAAAWDRFNNRPHEGFGGSMGPQATKAAAKTATPVAAPVLKTDKQKATA